MECDAPRDIVPFDVQEIGEESESDRAFRERDEEPDSILQTLDLLHRDQRVEIRVLRGKGMQVKRFADHREAARFVRQHDGSVRGIYTLLNPFDASKIKNEGVDDASIARRCWLLVDCDPIREPDTNSTDAELR